MFCDSCGAALQAGQSYCPRCGKAIVPITGPNTGRLARHVHVLAILWVVYSALHVLGAGVLMIIANVFFVHFREFMPPGAAPPPAMPLFIRPLLSFIGMALAIKGVAGIIAGIGLLQRQSWARVLTLVLGFISLLNIPLGTAMGIYTIWVLLSPNADAEYRELSGAAGA